MDTNANANLVAPSVYEGGSQVAYPLARKAEETLRDIPHPDKRCQLNYTRDRHEVRFKAVMIPAFLRQTPSARV